MGGLKVEKGSEIKWLTGTIWTAQKNKTVEQLIFFNYIYAANLLLQIGWVLTVRQNVLFGRLAIMSSN